MFRKIREGWALYKTLKAQGKVPLSTKAIIIAAIIYVISPLDLIPDPILIIGFVDDIAVAAGAVYYAIKWLEQRANPADKARAKAIDVTPKQ